MFPVRPGEPIGATPAHAAAGSADLARPAGGDAQAPTSWDASSGSGAALECAHALATGGAANWLYESSWGR